ncbi:putative 2-heptaprenyl-1 [Aspergillus affinis]|uniref:putative 2-heptaprenyl-1 n=1 Tax=Aspergillus affinis TaxID=1070780 RepID=UPI0022FF2C3B|nr:putative 2-heptaprenyl-1 [Aspergillus affinis]KAI9036827.1 putative 2-heptaprenyl-1 [Aspergillus affinis]
MDSTSDPLGIMENQSVKKLIESFIQSLSSESTVLSVGCLASLPVLLRLSSAGHQIYGIDRCHKTIGLVKSQIPGHFDPVSEIEYMPQQTFDSILVILSIDQLSRAQICSLVFKMGDWLKPGGSILLVTSPAEHLAVGISHNQTEYYVRQYPLHRKGDVVQSTLLSSGAWISVFAKAGLVFDNQADFQLPGGESRHSDPHCLMCFHKSEKHSVLGPYPLPDKYRGPIPLSEAAWKPFVERLVRDEFGFVLQVLENNQRVLDVGSGYGRLPIEVAARTGKAYSIEPNADRNSIQAANARDRGVEIAQGSAENIPYPDGHFDAVVAMWVMHYVEDLERSLREIVRVTDRSAPFSRIVIVQGAPDNEIIDLMNTVCAPVSASNPLPNHQGYLLHKAVEVFAECGFGDITFHRVDAYCEFKEQELSERCEKAAEVIAGLWCLEDSNFDGMKEALIPRLKFHFLDRPHAIGDQVALLVARPSEEN